MMPLYGKVAYNSNAVLGALRKNSFSILADDTFLVSETLAIFAD
jgi:hypothetical protein